MKKHIIKNKYNHLGQQHGVTLIEALVALVIMVAGTAAIFGIHGHVSATNTMNRMELIATNLVNEKLEELRKNDYTVISASNNLTMHKDPLIDIDIPGVMQNRTLTLTRCWSIEEVDNLKDSMIRVKVGVLNGDHSCNNQSFNSINLLSEINTLIARHDPRAAAINLVDQTAFDGEGRLVDGKPEGENIGDTTGGFEIIEDDMGVTRIWNPDTNQYLENTDSSKSLKYTQISGNILINDEKLTHALLSQLEVRAEGAASCRRYYPNSKFDIKTNSFDSKEEIPKISANSKTIYYIQYSCIVANNWRRSIFLSLPQFYSRSPDVTTDYASCVGHPSLQGTNILDDLLKSPGRQYTGFTWKDASKTKRVPVGMRGSSDGSSLIGTVCPQGTIDEEGNTVGETCWLDPNIHGWIPGGHHFFIKTGTTLCADSMRQVLTVDCNGCTEEALYDNTSSATVNSWYYGIFHRNPHKNYCANDKSYTIDKMTELENLIASGTNTTNSPHCISSTIVSGFFTNDVIIKDLLNPRSDKLEFDPDPRLPDACQYFGPFNGSGGAYNCAISERAMNDSPNFGLVKPTANGIKFTPSLYSGSILNPDAYPHDITSKHFIFEKD